MALHITGGSPADGVPSAKGVHVNFSWRQLEDVNYPRMTGHGGRSLRVWSSTAQQRTLLSLPAEQLLCTRGAAAALSSDDGEQPRKECRLCHEYDQHLCCSRGARCNFVHYVTLNEAQAEPKQRIRRTPLRVDAKPVACPPAKVGEASANRNGCSGQREEHTQGEVSPDRDVARCGAKKGSDTTQQSSAPTVVVTPLSYPSPTPSADDGGDPIRFALWTGASAAAGTPWLTPPSH